MENVNSISISKLWKDILNILGLPIPKLGLHHDSASFSFPQYFQFISCLSLFLTLFFLCFAPTSPKVKIVTSDIRSLELEVLWNLKFNLFMNNWKQCFPIFWKLKNLHDIASMKNVNMHNVIKWNTILKNKCCYSNWKTFWINWPRYLVFFPKFLLGYYLLKMVVATFNEYLITMISIS